VGDAVSEEIGKTIEEAYQRAFDGDSVSAFGGIVALNRTLTADLARKLVVPFLECVIAPDVSPEALSILASKKNLRVLTLPALARATQSAKGGNATKDLEFEFKGLRGALLTQDADAPEEWSAQFKIIGTTPTSEIQRDMIFAQKVVRHVKSNAIVVARHGQTVGICGGQTNRVDSVRMALTRAKATAGAENQQWVLASDAFFPFRDSVDLAASAGVKWIIQPGGSLRDAEVEAAVLEHGLGMVVTGRRHFKH
jgi:phosphoribosylaminoimidazolecarboxamide formyltransferase/IMP cyclohydrolase